MPKITIEKVLTFSSEDPHHPAANILNSDPARKWKCARIGEKMASVVLQLEKATQISGIDIGNENSAYIEVLVGRSSSGDEFRPLLGMSSFMSPLEARNHQNINKVRMLTEQDFSKPEANEKWDRVKIVCIQPYNKHVQYGLAFVTIHTNEGNMLVGKKNVSRFTLRPDSPTAFSVGSLFMKEMESLYTPPSMSSLKGAAAIREASTNPSNALFKSPTARRTPTSDPTPSTSRDDSSEGPLDEGEKKITKLKLRQQINVESRKTPKTGDNRKRKSQEHQQDDPTTTPSPENAKSPAKKQRTDDVLKEHNASMGSKMATTMSVVKAGPSKPMKRCSTDAVENEAVAPRKVRKVHEQRRPFKRLLDDVVIVISGIQNPERAHLRSSALAMGARYKVDWDDDCTHLICAFANTPKFIQVRGKGKIVRKEWIFECEKQRKRLPWRRFCLDRRDAAGNESEEEIVEETTDSKHRDDEGDVGGGDEVDGLGEGHAQHDRDEDATAIDDRLPALPNYFSGLTFYLSGNLGALAKELTKYIIGYGGKIAADYDAVGGTLIAVAYGDYDDGGVDSVQELRKRTNRLISPTWVLACHNKEHRLPFGDYLL